MLLAQALGLLHLAVDTHTLGEDGSIHDVAQLIEDAHESNDPHLCSPEADSHLAPLLNECAVLATWRAAVEVQPLIISLPSLATTATSFTAVAHTRAPQDVLSRAPKSSPPAV